LRFSPLPLAAFAPLLGAGLVAVGLLVSSAAGSARRSEAEGSRELARPAVFARTALTSEDFASAGLALDAAVFFGALEALVLLARSDLFVPTGYLFLVLND